MKNFVSVCLSIAAIIFSIWAICHVSPSERPLDFDYQGLLVGVLSLLVTCILGWQIYSVLSTEARLKKLSKLYHDISEKNIEIEDRINCAKYYIEAMSSLMENSFHHELDKKDGQASIVSLSNDYIRLLETFGKFLKAKDTKYPILCLLNADACLNGISEYVKQGETIPPTFNQFCDNLFNELLPDTHILSNEDIDFFHALRARRKSLSSEHHNPPVTNPWGIRLSRNRVAR